MSDEKINLPAGDESKKCQDSETEFLEFIAECLDEGWCPTKCEKNCIVEPDGECQHGFKSVALELGFI